MTPLARVRASEHGATAVAAVEGEIDTSNVEQVATALRDLVTNRSAGLVVDLSATRYLDSAGINLLFELGGDLVARQLSLRLVVEPASSIARMLAITGLDRAYPTFGGLAEALA